MMTTISDQEDIEIVGEVGKHQDLADAVSQTRPDVLIVAMDEREKYRAQCGFLLGRYPEMKILALGPAQNRAQLFWAIVDIRCKALESSEEGILGAMRQQPGVVGLVEL